MRPIHIATPLFAATIVLGGCATLVSKLEPAREVSCFPTAKVSLRAAVEAAEKQGGRVIDAHYHQSELLGCVRNEPATYQITLLSEGMLRFASVNASSDTIESHSVTPTAREQTGQFFGAVLDNNPDQEARIAPSIALRLSDAIAIAEQGGGSAMKAYVSRKSGKAGYTVKLVDRGVLRVTWIDGGRTLPSNAPILARLDRADSEFETLGVAGNTEISFLAGADDDEDEPATGADAVDDDEELPTES